VQKQTLSVALTYAAAVLVLSFYGVEVCPYLEGLGYIGTAPSLVISFTAAFIIRTFVRNALPASPMTVLLKEWTSWLLAGGGAALYNSVALDFPIASGAKLMIGAIALGLPSATHTALLVERQRIQAIRTGGERRTPSGPIRSTTSRLYRFTVFSQLLLAAVVILLVTKDVHEFVEALAAQRHPPVELIAVEIFGAFAVLLIANAIVAAAYARNLDILFQGQISAMQAVAKGDLSVVVPVVANDELARIGHKTNAMIQSLRERERMKSVFGKILSPRLAEALVASDDVMQLGGTEIQAAVAFTDLRDFTSLAEQLSPEELIRCLNEYFSMIVPIVHAQGGVVDKFIGDSAMLVFGLEANLKPQEIAERAMTACLDIVDSMGELNRTLTRRGLPEIRAGIGLNLGQMVAGNVGSPDRLEYTVIGDAVNIAARLEGLCKQVDSTLVVAESCIGLVKEDLVQRMQPLGAYPLKGKEETIQVFGLKS